MAQNEFWALKHAICGLGRMSPALAVVRGLV